ncbi:MAG TPA: CBS domain-containing protein [Steroidobacteraceae bacterium]|nr:CBS domain-containing protein [Steroidobacteraceae bacterium]
MKVADVMTDRVELVGPETTVSELARRMRDDDVGVLPVAADERLVGVVTDRDIVVRALADGLNPDSVSARDIMTDRVLYCYADDSAEHVLENLGDVHVRRLPVVDRDKKLIGIVSLGDLAAGGSAGKAGEALKDISRAPPSR